MATFLSADWRNLVMLNYEIDPAILQPLVPKATELDSWDDRTFVSLVGFRFLNTRVMGITIPFHRNFEEINLRFYVRHKSDDEWRRGVVFVKEIVPRPAIALVARAFYNENYVALPTRNVIEPAGADFDRIASASYVWRFRGAESSISLRTETGPIDFEDSSEEDFIAQHYWGYARQRDGGTIEYHVEHPPWRRIWRCPPGDFEGDAGAMYGSQFIEALSREPTSSFLAEGSAILVHKGVRIA